MTDPQIVSPSHPRRFLFGLLGLGVLAVNKVRYAIGGYREPRPFSPLEYTKAAAYDHSVVSQWLDALHDYTGQTVKDKVVLELGPGADLGPALILLDAGAARYVTVDAHRLITQTPKVFYDHLLTTLTSADLIKPELEKTLAGTDDRIQYIVDPTFDLPSVVQEPVDVVVSQAAFEHFSNLPRTIAQLGEVVHPGGVLIAEIDLLTHTGVLRTRDPLNIYRFPNWLYRLARFAGIPNRVRPQTYVDLLEANGWYNVEVIPLQVLSPEDLKNVQPQLARPFQTPESQMEILTFLLRATKR